MHRPSYGRSSRGQEPNRVLRCHVRRYVPLSLDGGVDTPRARPLRVLLGLVLDLVTVVGIVVLPMGH